MKHDSSKLEALKLLKEEMKKIKGGAKAPFQRGGDKPGNGNGKK